MPDEKNTERIAGYVPIVISMMGKGPLYDIIHVPTKRVIDFIATHGGIPLAGYNRLCRLGADLSKIRKFSQDIKAICDESVLKKTIDDYHDN